MFICLHVLQVKDGEAKLFDLRFSRKGKVLTETLEGTLPYMSPEMLSCEKYTRKTDIFSLGICLWELWYGRPVYSKPFNHGPAELIKSVTGGQKPSCDRPNAMPPALQAIISECWELDHNKRPESFQVAIHIGEID